MENNEIIAAEARLLLWLSHPTQKVLEAACDDAASSEVRRETAQRLGSYGFEGPGHQVIFDCLSNLVGRDPAVVRDILSARLVRAGFPGIEFNFLFGAHALSNSDATQLADTLLAAHSQKQQARS